MEMSNVVENATRAQVEAKMEWDKAKEKYDEAKKKFEDCERKLKDCDERLRQAKGMGCCS